MFFVFKIISHRSGLVFALGTKQAQMLCVLSEFVFFTAVTYVDNDRQTSLGKARMSVPDGPDMQKSFPQSNKFIDNLNNVQLVHEYVISSETTLIKYQSTHSSIIILDRVHDVIECN